MPPRKKTNTIILTVSQEFVLPEFYTKAEQNEIEEALVIGSVLYTTVKAASTSKEIQAIEAEKNTQIANIRTQADTAIRTLEEQIQKADATIQTLKREKAIQIQESEQRNQETEINARKAERELATKQHEQKLKSLEAELASLQEKNQLYLERKRIVESSRDQDIETAEKRTHNSLKELLEEKDRTIRLAREDLEKANLRQEKTNTAFQEILAKHSEEVRALKDAIHKRSSNAKTKGSEFEEAFRLKLITAYGTNDQFGLDDTAKNGFGHAGDYLMKWGDEMILWETKNYDRPVPDEEVKKFKRDMKENTHVNIGVMVSRYTPITGKTTKGDFYTEFVEGKMLIYISNFDRMSEDVLPMLMIYFKLYWKFGKKLEEDDGKVHTIRKIEKLHGILEDKKKEWRVIKSQQETAIRFTADLVEDLEHQLKYLLNDLQGIVETVKDIPPNIFRDCTGDELSLQKIQVILSCVEPNSEDSLELNELAEMYGKKRGNLSRDTAKTHIRSVLLDSVIQPSRGKTASRVLGLSLKETTI